jgi:diguanylate cyclase (GGDEF)-like protein
MADHPLLFLVILVSVVAQTAAAWIALRQMGGVQGAYRAAWACIALALALMVQRRLAPLWRLVQDSQPSSLTDALFGLAISLFMVAGIYGLRRLFADLDRQRTALDELAHTDPLTKLANRRALMQRAQMELDRAARTGRPLALLMFDIDHFKRVNDTYGHAAGDAVLAGVAATAQAQFRRIDLCGRVGGEEFVVVLPETDPEHARAAAERLRGAIAATSFGDIAPGLTVTISIGLVSVEEVSATLDVLLARADAALYRAKDGGRNRVMTSDSD